jgi:hypothetical protein
MMERVASSVPSITTPLKGVALHGKVEIADDKTANDVTDRAAREENVHFMGACDVRHQRQSALLIRRQPGFHQIYKVSHQVRITQTTRPALKPAGFTLSWILRKLHFIQGLDGHRRTCTNSKQYHKG